MAACKNHSYGIQDWHGGKLMKRAWVNGEDYGTMTDKAFAMLAQQSAVGDSVVTGEHVAEAEPISLPPKSYVDKNGVQCGQPDTCKACSSKLTFLGPAQNNLLCCPNEACSLFRNRVLWLIPSYLP